MAAFCSDQNCPSKLISGSVQQAFITASPSVNRVTRRSGPMPNAANGRPRPPVPNPISSRPWLS